MERVRPRLHFTAERGFTNDPYGVVHVDGEYHLFFQHNPDGTTWVPQAQWGHAVSTDLLTWRQLPSALRPEPDETGCWSGSAVIDDGEIVLIYTAILPERRWSEGAVAVARPVSGTAWRRDPPGPVIDGPPPVGGYSDFRDPQVRRDGRLWRAVIGAGIEGRGGCALQYSSPDLTAWDLDGVLAAGLAVDTGQVWECPQLLPVDGRWVLLISVVVDSAPRDVMYAVGDLVSDSFRPQTWGVLGHGLIYATTTFTDEGGRPCSLSWIPERSGGAPASAWRCAVSLPHRLRIVADRLAVAHHPALDERLPPAPLDIPSRVEATDPWRIAFDPPAAGARVEVVGERPWTIEVDGAGLRVLVDGTTELTMPGPVGRVDVVVDADICEVMAAGAVGVCRVPAASQVLVRAD